MRVRIALLAAALCLCARAQVLVQESGIRAHLANGATAVTLAVESRENRPVNAIVELQWLGPLDQREGLRKTEVTIRPGHSAVEMAMPLSGKIADPLLERLRYQLIPERKDLAAFEAVTGIVSFIHIADYAFTLRVISPDILQPDRAY